MQALAPDQYAELALEDQWIEDAMQQREAEWICRQLGVRSRVLDLGWGSGIIARALKDHGHDVLVVEGAKQSVETAWNAGIPAVHSMFEDYRPLARFDCVIASFVLEHVERPVELLHGTRRWADQLIVVAGNALSYHRQLAVAMGLQATVFDLSARDKAVGHHFVYDQQMLTNDLLTAGWRPIRWEGIMLKPLPNAMLKDLDKGLLKAMVQCEVAPVVAANIACVCVPR